MSKPRNAQRSGVMKAMQDIRRTSAPGALTDVGTVGGMMNWVQCDRGNFVIPETALDDDIGTWAVLAQCAFVSYGGQVKLDHSGTIDRGGGASRTTAITLRWSVDRGATWNYFWDLPGVPFGRTAKFGLPSEVDEFNWTEILRTDAKLRYDVQTVGYHDSAGPPNIAANVEGHNIIIFGNIAEV